MVKAPLAQEVVGSNPMGRGKNGSKRSVLVVENGIPLSLVVSGVNRHDMKLLVPILSAILTPRPSPTATGLQHLCVDRGYSGQPAADAMKIRGYKPHVHQRGEEIAAKTSGGCPVWEGEDR